MRDFHAQKLLFKVINQMVERRQASDNEMEKVISKDLPNWSMAHIYVIDYFLWFMAKRGYTLQRSRAKVDFKDIADDFEDYEKKERAMFDKFILERKNENQ
jgi:hypothetical protein